MLVGVPKEIKQDEYRAAMLPAGVGELTRAGHQVIVQASLGEGAGITDELYLQQGARIVSTAEEVFAQADMIVKVKEPMLSECELLRPGQILFTYLHLAASQQLTQKLIESRVTAIAYETVRGRDGSLPCLTPMSEVAGRMSVQQGARFLERPQGGRGVLLGGIPGVQPANVTIFGGGVVGKNAAIIAAGFQANVVIMDVNVSRLRELSDIMPANVRTLYSDRQNIEEQIRNADLIIGGVLIPGAKAPRLVTREDLKIMKPGSVIVDVCIDQGGCFETSRPTTHSDPVYTEEGVVHYCVTNMPGAVSRTSTYGLCNVTFPYIFQVAHYGLKAACQKDLGMVEAVNLHQGLVTNEAVAKTFDLPYSELVL